MTRMRPFRAGAGRSYAVAVRPQSAEIGRYRAAVGAPTLGKLLQPGFQPAGVIPVKAQPPTLPKPVIVRPWTSNNRPRSAGAIGQVRSDRAGFPWELANDQPA